MDSPTYRVRRATLDDFGALKALWAGMNFSGGDLEKRLTEFQVAEDASAKILGAIGFQISERQGLIHSEAFEDFTVADQIRPLFWARIQTLAMNHGLVRLWTQENAPFWTHSGLQPAGQDALERLPKAWNPAAAGGLTLRLKDEDVVASLDKEFAMFTAFEKRSMADTLNQARKLKLICTIAGIIFALTLLAAAFYQLLKHKLPGSLPP